MDNSCASSCAEALKGLKIHGMDIGKELEKRITSGKLDEDRVTAYENEWIKKLECLDEAHSTLSGLCIKDAERTVATLRKFARSGTQAACPQYKNQVLSCLKHNKYDMMRCGDEIAAFRNCVDEMLLQTSRQSDECSGEKKAPRSYTEKFEQLGCN